MATLNELKAELAKEKGYALNEHELNKIGQERKNIELEIKRLRFNRKYGKYVSTGQNVTSGFKDAFGKLGKEVGKLQQEQNSRERQNKAIKKRGIAPVFSDNRKGLFG